MTQEKEYWLRDPETGYRYKVTKKQYENYMEMWELCKPKIDSSKCVPILYGTGGELDKSWGEFFNKIKLK